MCQFKEIFIIPPNRLDFFFKSHFYKFLNFWSQSTSYNFVNRLFMSIFWTVNHWRLLLSFFINYLFVFDSGMSSMVDLMIVSSYYLWADSPLLHCVLVYVPVWLCALSCMFVSCLLGRGGEWGETVLCIYIKYIFFLLSFLFRKLYVSKRK